MYLYPENYGAIGNGINDDTLSLQMCINDARNLGYPVLFTHPSYLIKKTLQLHSKTRLVSYANSIIYGQTHFQSPVLELISIGSCSIQGLQIDCSTCHTGIQISNGANILLEDCSVYGNPKVTNFLVNAQSYSVNVKIQRCHFSDALYGIKFESNVERSDIKDNEFMDWVHQAVLLRGLAASGIREIKIEGNNFINPLPQKGGGRQMIALYNHKDIHSQSFETIDISHNKCYGPYGFYDRNSSTSIATADQIVVHYAKDFKLVGNRSTGGGEIGITIAYNCSNGLVTENYIEGADGHGLQVGYENGIGCKHISIINNVITNNGRREDQQGDVMAQLYCQRLKNSFINGNTFFEDSQQRKTKHTISLANCEDIDIGVNSWNRVNQIGFEPIGQYNCKRVEILK